MGEAIGEAGIEHDRPPARPRQELAVGAHLVTHGCVHPAVDAENPEGGNRGADRHHQRGGEMELLADPLHPEQHDAEEARFEEEGGQHFIGHQRPDNRPCHVRKHRPVGAELVTHDDPAHDAHGESDREDLEPVFEQVEIERLARLQPQTFENREIARQPDRKSREDEMEAHREGELYAGEQQGVETIKHRVDIDRPAAPSRPSRCAQYPLRRRAVRS